jgi:glutamate carboxypeptidase
VDRSTLVAAMEARTGAILADIETLVRCESPSSVPDAVAKSADLVAAVGQRHLGTAPELIVLDGCPHLRWRLGNDPASGTPQPPPGGTTPRTPQSPPGGTTPRTPRGRVLVLAHHDTVWPLGSLGTHPFSVADGILRGPGCFDMKAGLVLALHALAVLGVPDGVTLLVTGDEEIGSPSSRALIEAEAAGCVAALVLEASADGGALKTARKGVSLYQVRAVGRAAHAGLEPERGVNATVELAHQVLAVAGLADAALGTTVTPTALSSGTVANTVPAAGAFSVDVRMWDTAEQARVHAAMSSLLPAVPDAALEISGGPNRPPLAASSSAALFALASSIATELGLAPLESAPVGGASDGNFTAGVGTPTLDGLGAVGGGAHADHEHVLVDALPGRAALLAALIDTLLTAGLATGEAEAVGLGAEGPATWGNA